MTEWFETHASPLLAMTAIIVGCSLFMYLIKRITMVQLNKNNLLANNRFTSVLLQSINIPSNLFIVLINLLLLKNLLQYFNFYNEELTEIFPLVLKIWLLLTILVFFDRLVSNTVTNFSQTSESMRTSRSIIKGSVKVLIFGIGGLIILSTIGIPITPIVASLGITSLAVALALQPTLENFFSGVQLVMDKPIRVGDYIELDSGEQGFVEKIGWRSTWIKMLPNNIVVMPNSKLAQSKIINYYYPEKELSVPVEVGVHYNSDLEHVENVALDVARQILKSHKWGVDEYETFVVFHTFDSSSINFTVMLRAKEYFNRFFIKSAYIKALHKRFAQEGITIPYPIRAINIDQEKAMLNQSE